MKNNENKTEVCVFIGLDLSLNSTGINILVAEKFTQKQLTMNFDLVLFEKHYKSIKNTEISTFTHPKNITTEDLAISRSKGNYYQLDQINITRKFVIVEKILLKTIYKRLNKIKSTFSISQIIVSIEGFIMPELMGQVQFRSLTSLIMLQGTIRSNLLRNLKDFHENQKTYPKFNIVSPTKLKKHFSGNGRALKEDMLDAFINLYEGEKLIDCTNVNQVNDLVDAFALNVNGFHKYFYPDHYNLLFGDKDELRNKKRLEKIKARRKLGAENRKNKSKPTPTQKQLNSGIDFSKWLP